MAPRRISGTDARARLSREWSSGGCLMCALRDGAAGPRYVLATSPEVTTLLSRYPRRWGHVLVIPHLHCTRFEDLPADVWREATGEALRAARAVERELRPARCYVASFGSSDGPMSSSHLHVHVIPVYEAAERPKAVLDADGSVFAADDAEWDELHGRLLEVWHRP